MKCASSFSCGCTCITGRQKRTREALILVRVCTCGCWRCAWRKEAGCKYVLTGGRSWPLHFLVQIECWDELVLTRSLLCCLPGTSANVGRSPAVLSLLHHMHRHSNAGSMTSASKNVYGFAPDQFCSTKVKSSSLRCCDTTRANTPTE